MSTIDRARTLRSVAPTRSTTARPPRPQHRDRLVDTPTRPARAIPPTDRRRSTTTGLIFKVVLGAAACLALVGVVAEATSDPTAVDADPPTVIVD